jgi:hypothetical protein
MESVEALATKRRVLVDALMMCLQRSRVCQLVDAATVRGVIDSASRELWREGEFRLDPIWKMLVAQPELSAEVVAPPLLLFKAYEKELGVSVRVPQQLTAIPRAEQVRLREALGVQKQDFQAAIDEMRALAVEQSQRRISERRDAANLPGEVESGTSARPPTGKVMTPPPGSVAAITSGGSPAVESDPAAATGSDKRALALALGVLALVALSFACWLALRDTASTFNVGDVSGSLQLINGRAAGGSMTATIIDGRWDGMSAEERRTAVSAVMDIESGKGIKVMTLLDKGGNARAIVNEGPDGRNIVLP